MKTAHEYRPSPSGKPYPRGSRPGRQPAVPAYVRIADTIADQLASGLYEPGARLPSESQLCTEFGVSHMTVRRALGVLTSKGLVSAEQGRGTFARAFDLSDSVFSLGQLLDTYADGPIEVRVLSASTICANSRVASMLALAVGEPVLYFRHLVLCSDTPVIYHREHVPHDSRRPLVDLLVQSTSLHGLLNAPGEEGFPRGKITLRATALGRAAAKILDEPAGAPALCIDHLFRDTSGLPASWGYFLLRAHLFTLHSCLGPEPADA